MENNKEEQLDQLIVRVWKLCNFKCNFCNVDYNERHVSFKESTMDLVRNFLYKFKYSQVNNNKILVTISWWEPSILQKETIFIIKYINMFLWKKGITPLFNIQSNASNITLEFANKLKELWVIYALISFHTNDKDIFEEMIWIDYQKNFWKILVGINNLNKAWIDVELNSIISKQNSTNFLDNIEFLLKNFPFVINYNIGVIQPHWHAFINSEKTYVQYKEVAKLYNKGISILKKNDKNISSHFTGLPACYIEEKKYYLEWEENLYIRQNTNFNEINLINKINDDNKIQTKDCEDCIYNNICWGIWTEYKEYQILKPIKYKKIFEKNIEKYILNKNADLKKIYTSWIRNIIISTDIFEYDELIDIIRKINKLGFYKITLYITKKIIITDELLKTWVWNIQVNIENINFTDINRILIFSKKYAPQFGINLDLLFYNYDLEKYNLLLRLLENRFLKIYLIHELNNTNNDIKNFKKILSPNNRWQIFTVNFYKYFIYN